VVQEKSVRACMRRQRRGIAGSSERGQLGGLEAER
jgi:hypothetical protein